MSPLPPDALYRLMGWFPALRQLSGASRARLVDRLAGHPRSVEYANDLLAHTLAKQEDREDLWHLSEEPGEADPEREWAELVAPVLPDLRDKLWANLLLAEIWGRVLDDRARRMVFRMTLLRIPWEWKLVAVLGEEGEGENAAFATAERLRGTSLLEAMEALGESEKAIRFLDRQLVIAREIGDRAGEGSALGNLGSAYGNLGEWERAIGCFEQQLAIAHESGDRRGKGRALSNLGTAYASLGESGKAVALLEQALEIGRAIKDPQIIRGVTDNLARLRGGGGGEGA